MAITIKFAADFNTAGALYASAQTFDQSKWLGERGWWFYGQRTDPKLAAKLRAAGVPINSRWLPVSKKEVAAAILGAEGVEWTPEARAVVEAAAEAQEASRAMDADVEIPVPPHGLEYRPYQKAGIAFALRAFDRGQKGVLLADEMGVGKTMQAIGVMSVLQPNPVLVLCPASLRVNWQREIEKWLPTWRGAVRVVNGDCSVAYATGVTIVNYDKLAGRGEKAEALRAMLLGTAWDLVVCDEAHMLKNEKAQRTKAVFGTWARGKQEAPGIIDHANHVLLLTGTPIQNKVRESIPIIRALGGFGPDGVAKSEYGFLLRHCGPSEVWTGRKYVKTFDGATHLDELQAKLRSGWMVRRLKADVETELPPKLRSVLYLPCDDADLRLDDEEGRRMVEGLERAEGDFGEAVAKLVGTKMSFEEISRYRVKLAKAKAPYVVQRVADLLDEDSKRKVLVFGHHQVLLEALAAEFDDRCIKITGAVAPEKRQALVDAFQTDPEIRVAVLSTHAAGVGLTLTAASHEVMAEPDWNPAWCAQAEDRAHRIGQTAEKLPIEYLVVDGTIDAHVVQTMVKKMDVADRALDRRQAAGKAPAAPPPPPAPKPGAPRVVTVGKNGEVRTYKLTDDRREAAREALLIIAGRCDGALARDAQGFDGRDARSEFVQSLVQRAVAGEWSDRWAAWALKVIVKYVKTQVPEYADRLFPGGEEE